MTETQSKICQNCKQNFTIEPDDFQFYEKIKVPPPTWCPDCRLERRLVFRNERSLYRDICDLCKKSIFSLYAPEKPFTVYCRECWYGDGWDPLAYGRAYDWNKSFFAQLRQHMQVVPRIALAHYHVNVNCEYTNFIANSKNCYLSYSIVGAENTYYSRLVDKSKDIFDSITVTSSEQGYELVDSVNIHGSQFIMRSRDCISSSFLFDCVNCQNCFMSSNLRNRQFVLRNKQYSREEYENLLKKERMNSAMALAVLKKEFRELVGRSLHRYANLIKCTDSTGDNILNCKDVKDTFEGYDVERARFSARLIGPKDIYDVYGCAKSELIYEGNAGGWGGYDVKFFMFADAEQRVQFADWCHGSSDVFGCVSLRKKQHCILNTQYTKEEYEELVPKIIHHMSEKVYEDTLGRTYPYGEYFPPELSPFAYNESLANDFFSRPRGDAGSHGYTWREPDAVTYHATKNATEIPDTIEEVSPDIVKEILECGACKKAYRIIEPEIQFLRSHGIALPRACPECRYRERFSMRHPLKLWRRQCMCDYHIRTNTAKHQQHESGRCPNEFETSYAPDRKEVVYCEECYQREVV